MLDTRLMMDNKKDLAFVFDGIVKEAKSMCSSDEVFALVQQVFALNYYYLETLDKYLIIILIKFLNNCSNWKV